MRGNAQAGEHSRCPPLESPTTRQGGKIAKFTSRVRNVHRPRVGFEVFERAMPQSDGGLPPRSVFLCTKHKVEGAADVGGHCSASFG